MSDLQENTPSFGELEESLTNFDWTGGEATNTETNQPTPTESDVTPTEVVEEEKPSGIQGLLDTAINAPPKNALTDFNELIDAASTGVGDTIFDTVGMVGKWKGIPWMNNLDSWWDENNPELNDPSHEIIRKVSAIVIPSMIGGGAVIGTAANATKTMAISSAMRTLGKVAAQTGVNTAVVGVSSQSVDDPNAAAVLNEWLGWNLPWATSPNNSPELNRKLHMYESAGMDVAVDLLRAIFSVGKQVRYIANDRKAQKILEREAAALKDSMKPNDFISQAIEPNKAARKQSRLDEALKRIVNGKKVNKGYDPFVNKPSTSYNKAVTDLNNNALAAKSDLYQIQNNKGTIDGQMRPSASKAQQDSLKNASTSADRTAALEEYRANDLDAKGRYTVDSKNFAESHQLDEAVNKLTDAVFNPDVSFKQFRNIVDSSKVTVFRGRRFMDEDSWVRASYAYKRAFDSMFNPKLMRASAMQTQQAADTIASASRAIEVISGVSRGTRQYEIIFDKMRLLAGEVRANKYISNRVKNMRKLMEAGKTEELAKWLANQTENFDEFLIVEKRKSAKVLQELDSIAKQHPEYLRPFQEAYKNTNGNVDTLEKLHTWAEANIGLIKKGIYDRNPEMPSWVIQGLHGIRYNSILSGLSAVKAMTGNLTLSALKPISVFAGASLQGDVGTLKRALYTYGGFSENIKRGFKVMGDEWRLANSNPEVAIARGRKDLQLLDMEQFEAMEAMADGWKAEGKLGKVAMWNFAKALSYWNNNKYVRYGINAMYAIDGFTNSLMASGSARAKAYDALFSKTNGSFLKSDFKKLQQRLYDRAFDSTGKLTDEAANFASKEVKLNLDYELVDKLNHIINHVPAAKPLFLFPRTGINALELGWSFNPVSNLAPGITRAQRALRAETVEQIAEVMGEHGLENTPEAFKALQSEYIGRQIMGSTVIMGAGLWALEGNLTGNGPQDPAERRRMLSMGWKPLSVKNPFTGHWHSLRGFEPFEQIVGLVGDFIYHSDRVDQTLMEDKWNKLRYAISMNITNNTFLAGFEPLVSMMNGDEFAWNRFIATMANQSAPFAGVRSILNNIVTPQLKDVENDWKAMLKNQNKFLYRNNPDPNSKEGLSDMLDVYTGKPLKTWEEMNVACNALLPVFKCNGDMEPWRQWLLSTGWDGLQRVTTNRVTGFPLSTEDRRFLNNHIATYGGLREQIIEMMEHPESYYDKEIAKYKKTIKKQQFEQKDFPIKKLLTHRKLQAMHDKALDNAFIALAQFYEQYKNQGRMKRYRDKLLGKGDIESATEVVTQLKEIQEQTQ